MRSSEAAILFWDRGMNQGCISAGEGRNDLRPSSNSRPHRDLPLKGRRTPKVFWITLQLPAPSKALCDCSVSTQVLSVSYDGSCVIVKHLQMTSDKDIWQILEGIKLETETSSIDERCTICKKLLIDAMQGPCGCNYCRKCIVYHLSKGNNACPGASKDCLKVKMILRENIVKDIAADKRVSRLKIKCPHESCTFSSDLNQLSEHLRTCVSKPQVCPLTEIGCAALPMASDEISDHLTKDLYQHSLLLAEWIKNIRNEMASWKDKKEMKLPENELINKNQLLETITLEIRKHEKNRPKTEIVNQNVLKEIDNIKQENVEMRKIIEEMKDERNKFEKQMKDEIEQLKKELKDLKQVNGKRKSISTDSVGTRRDSQPKNIPNTSTAIPPIDDGLSASFSWEINMSPQTRKDSNYLVTSQTFYSTSREYEMKLMAFPGGCGLAKRHLKTHLCIKFCIKVASSSSQVQWPTNCIVRICLFNKIKPNKKIILDEKYFTADQSGTTVTDENYYFHCDNTEIDKNELIERNTTQVLCSIDPIKVNQ